MKQMRPLAIVDLIALVVSLVRCGRVFVGSNPRSSIYLDVRPATSVKTKKRKLWKKNKKDI